MLSKLFASATVLLILANPVQAQTPAPAAEAASKAEPRWLHFDARAVLRLQVHLLPERGKQGRDTAISTGYRPELRFPDARQGVTCALTLPPGPGGELEPGRSTEATAQCLDALKLREDRLQFQMFQGGRLVGEGRLLP